MYLSFAQKRKIFNSYPKLTEELMSNGRVNYRFLGSNRRKKVIARELTYTGNGYVYGEYLSGNYYQTDDRGWINIKDFSESQLRQLIDKVIESFK